MPEYMEQITALKEAEERHKDRFESRISITRLVTVIHATLECINGKYNATIASDEITTLHTSDYQQIRIKLREDAEDLVQQLNILSEIMLPASELVKDLKARAERFEKRVKYE